MNPHEAHAGLSAGSDVVPLMRICMLEYRLVLLVMGLLSSVRRILADILDALVRV